MLQCQKLGLHNLYQILHKYVLPSFSRRTEILVLTVIFLGTLPAGRVPRKGTVTYSVRKYVHKYMQTTNMLGIAARLKAERLSHGKLPYAHVGHLSERFCNDYITRSANIDSKWPVSRLGQVNPRCHSDTICPPSRATISLYRAQRIETCKAA